jgi:hypothetical protein
MFHRKERTTMNQAFELLETVKGKLTSYLQRKGVIPAEISISPGSYRRLVELKAWEGRIGNLIIGCFPVTEIVTPLGRIHIVIDEMLGDTAVEFA